MYDLAANAAIDRADAQKLVNDLIGTSMADTNLDGTVDIIDLGNLANKYGQAGGFGDGDTDFNGVIDVVDLGILANDYGKTYQIGAGGGTVPEPATLWLLVLGVSGALGRRRRLDGKRADRR